MTGKTLGILGGMGPEATAHFYGLLIRNTRVKKDQHHIRVVIWADPEVPPRTDAILGKGPSPVPHLKAGLARLAAAGAEIVACPCVTAHYFLPEALEGMDLTFLSLVEEAGKWALETIPGLKRVGIVSSTGTLISKLFHREFEARGVEVLAPVEAEQETVMEAIFGAGGIKAGFTSGPPKEKIVGVAGALIARGAEAVIAGCTEVPLVLGDEDIDVPLIEPMRITARAAVAAAGYEPRPIP